MPFPFVLISLVWLGGALLRVYRQARFYQIEEYMSLRYLRWSAHEQRWLPSRPAVAWLIGTAFGFVMTEAPGGVLLPIIHGIAALIAVYPPREGEVKKGFKPTARARRLLAAAFVVTALLLVALLGVLHALPVAAIEELYAGGVAFAGLITLLCAPLALVAGNVLMTPVEGALRARFIAQARRVLAEVHPVTIGITGSYGKTSTKHYLTHILNGRYKAYATPKSYNTLMGVCIAINNDLAQDHSIEYFVCEMGAYIPGEIARLVDLTHPSISLVVEVGPQHLERFGSLENIAIAKYEIIKGLPPDGIGVFNWDNPYIRTMFERGYPATRLTVSREVDPAGVQGGVPRFIASDVSETLAGLRFTVTDTVTGATQTFETLLLGIHTVTNLLMATAVAVHEGMTLADVARRVRGLQPAESRLVRQTAPGGVTILNDAYSANPVGAASALHVLSLHTGGRRLLVTPGMIELGDLHDQENRRLGTLAAAHATDVILVGAKQTAPIRDGLVAAGFDNGRLLTVETLAEAVEWTKTHLQAGDTVLFLNDLPDTYSTQTAQS